MNELEKSIREKVFEKAGLTEGEWVYFVGLIQADHDLKSLDEENRRLLQIIGAPLSSEEMRLVDKHCDWVAFGHAWNAVMKRRLKAIDHG